MAAMEAFSETANQNPPVPPYHNEVITTCIFYIFPLPNQYKERVNPLTPLSRQYKHQQKFELDRCNKSIVNKRPS